MVVVLLIFKAMLIEIKLSQEVRWRTGRRWWVFASLWPGSRLRSSAWMSGWEYNGINIWTSNEELVIMKISKDNIKLVFLQKVGVLEHSLLQARLKDRHHMQRDLQAAAASTFTEAFWDKKILWWWYQLWNITQPHSNLFESAQMPNIFLCYNQPLRQAGALGELPI